MTLLNIMETRDQVRSLNKEDENKALQLINLLEIQEESAEFLQPVDYKLLNIPDYPIIIKNPMDLGTIKKKIKSKKYKNLHEFINDIQLVWDNCKTYNDPSSEIYSQAEFMEKQMRRYCSKLKVPFPKSPNLNTQEEEIPLEEAGSVTFEEKWEMTEQVKKLPQSALEEIVSLVSTHMSEAVEKEEAEKVKVKLDLLDRETFEKVQEIIDRTLSTENPQKRFKKR